jgi:hypothetical protein
MIRKLSETSVQLCGDKKCCPIINKLEDGTYEVLDDYGNKIKVTKEDLDLVSDGVKALTTSKNDQLILG